MGEEQKKGFFRKVLDVAKTFGTAIPRRTPELLYGFHFVDGLLDPKLRVTCAQDEIDGRVDWVCWKCGKQGGLFSPETAVDIPKNSQGAWVRLHKRCA